MKGEASGYQCVLVTRVKGIFPPIWRRLSVPGELTLAELHAVLRAVGGWPADEACSFSVGRNWFGPPEPEHGVRSARRVTLASIVELGFPRFTVHHRIHWAEEDGWDQEVVVEDVVKVEARGGLACLGGARAHPPETFVRVFDYGAALESGQVAQPETCDVSKANAVLAALEPRLRDAAVSRAASRVKVGRNSACPCGSGRKFKACCHAREAAETEDERLDTQASLSGGPVLDPGLAARARARWTAFRSKRSPRRSPETPKPETRMHEGYALRDAGDARGACDAWWDVWTHVRERIGPEDSMRWDTEGLLSGECSIRTWTRDFIELVQAVASSSSKHAEMGVVYGRELLARFPCEAYDFQRLVCERLVYLLHAAGRADEMAEFVRSEYAVLLACLQTDVPESRLPEARPLVRRLHEAIVAKAEGDPYFAARITSLPPDRHCEVVEDTPDLAEAMVEILEELEKITGSDE